MNGDDYKMVSELVEMTDYFIAALCVWREARGESAECQRGVYWTIVNRINHPQWPNTMSEVVLQKYQFSSFNAGDPNAIKFPMPGDTSWESCCDAIENPGTDPTQGACYYESFPDNQIEAIRLKQTWFAADKLTVQIGKIRFYKP